MTENRLPPTFQETDLNYYLRMIRGDYSEFEEVRPQKLAEPSQVKNIVVIFGSDSIGSGNEVLGKKLMYLFLQALINGPVKPRAIILLNSAVKMAQGKTESLDKLIVLEELGSKIMVCISSADEYNSSDNVHVGFVASMDEICETIMNAWKVISL
jgi:hypothetical protein